MVVKGKQQQMGEILVSDHSNLPVNAGGPKAGPGSVNRNAVMLGLPAGNNMLLPADAEQRFD